ncbi:MAG: HDOD domain-containing protein [Candidatus Eisenbacteria bacterium]|uniref:HDOD domain-containing protein n=1 Tax=Eiseniibacteriota bacterium TaxID=2212470 RepID=A0A849SKE2_UNCEI|nr:HDOD domain-containing protein [Candidatus Eisenbacteria bacterium]
MSSATPLPVPMDEDSLASALRARLESGPIELPLLPETATAVLAACRRDESGTREVAQIMQRDPALTANVLRIANSALYSRGAAIVSLPHAVGRLGISTVGEIAAAAVMRTTLFTNAPEEVSIEELWRHSACCANWAREIARYRRHSVEGAFLAGLLHDVGKPVLHHLIAQDNAHARHAIPIEVTRRVVEDMHGEIGGLLAERWNLAEWIAIAIAHHHHPENAPSHPSEVHTVALANHFAHVVSDSSFTNISHIAHPSVDVLDLYVEDLEALAERRDDVHSAVEAMP